MKMWKRVGRKKIKRLKIRKRNHSMERRRRHGKSVGVNSGENGESCVQSE